MEQNAIYFDGKKLFIKQSFRGLMEFEKLSGKEASKVSDSLNDMMMLFYSLLYTFDDFVDKLDEQPDVLTSFENYLLTLAGESTDDKKKEAAPLA